MSRPDVKTFVEVAGEALEETRAKLRHYLREPDLHWDAVNFSLGLFTGIALRRMRGEPDPDPLPWSGESGSATVSPDVTSPEAQKLENDTERE